MDEGLIFWLIVFAIAILQGIGQKKKADRKGRRPGEAGGGGREPSPPRPAPSRREAKEAGEGLNRPAKPIPSASSPAGTREEDSAEGMIPSEIWEEILGLARGQTRPEKPSRQTPPDEGPTGLEPAWEEVEWAGAGTGSDPVARGDLKALSDIETSEVGSSPAKVIGEAEEPPPSAFFEPPTGSRVTARPRARLFGDGSRAELRKAVVLREVLGPPLGLRGREEDLPA